MTLYIWQKEPEENTVLFENFNMAVVSKTEPGEIQFNLGLAVNSNLFLHLAVSSPRKRRHRAEVMRRKPMSKQHISSFFHLKFIVFTAVKIAVYNITHHNRGRTKVLNNF